MSRILGRISPHSRSEADELIARVSELERKLAESVLKEDAEAKSRELTDTIHELESKLSESVPRTQIDAAKADAESRIQELQELFRNPRVRRTKKKLQGGVSGRGS
jgi:BMFP domain-containing protein YqiC